MATMAATGYCMKCKAQRDIKGAKEVIMKNGRPAKAALITFPLVASAHVVAGRPESRDSASRSSRPRK